MSISKNQLGIILSILVLLTTLTYYHRAPTGDDAWFAEQSYWLQKDGIIRSEFFNGILGWENQLLVSHKLFLVFGAGLMNVFGFQLPTVQFVGLVSFIAIIAEITVYLYKKEQSATSRNILLILILIFSNRLLVKMSFENRPELMLAALGFSSFLCLQAKSVTVSKSLLAGVLAGMAMLCHLNGIIYLIAGLGTLLYFRQYKNASYFALAGSFTGLLYFSDILLAENGFSTWYYQFRNDPATQNAFGWRSKLLVLLTFPKLFFESPEQASLSLLLAFLIGHQRAYLKQLPSALSVFSILLVTSFWLLTKHGSGTYLPLFMPFMLVLIYELYRIKPFKNWALAGVLATYFIIGIYGTIEIILQNFSNDYLPVAYQKLREHIPADEKGLVPLTYFFNEYERHPYLLSHENYKYHSIPTNNPPAHMANWAHQRGTGFILMDYQYRSEDFYPKPGTVTLPFFRLTYFDGRFAIYRSS
ncbi:hypothetical protein G8759_20735 [Spirosoma aureum]|uniref:Glycosyltransferase RgtA/B/C/D-like domain-containing protein n=1 Tax=Spirosoma aureum TaxID=2692134 RepID=A0A6G9AQV4_9BACT|nr:hypothetical protein [Spirosoma aureum]QIP14871.1 hypothetical protein G8759_20735 [Spirosoma aureum]